MVASETNIHSIPFVM